jgi:hypothetical protein
MQVGASQSEQDTTGGILYGDLLVVVTAFIIARDDTLNDELIGNGHRRPRCVPGLDVANADVGYDPGRSVWLRFCKRFLTPEKSSCQQQKPEQLFETSDYIHTFYFF